MNKALTISAFATVTAAGYYLHRLHRTLSLVKTSAVTVIDSDPPSLLESRTCRSVVNPRGYPGYHDTRTMMVILPEPKAHWTDEQILASFVKGFFGGWVFTPERLLFQSLKIDLVRFSRTVYLTNALINAKLQQ